MLAQAKEAAAPEELRGLEGVGASAYFGVLDEMILGDKETFMLHRALNSLPKIMVRLI